jgi:hypothetical protein
MLSRQKSPPTSVADAIRCGRGKTIISLLVVYLFWGSALQIYLIAEGELEDAVLGFE